MLKFPVLVLIAAGALPVLAPAAERACDQSDSTVIRSPSGLREASVQHQVCETSQGGAAAAVTVFVGPAGAALQGQRVAAIAVPRTRDEWPRVVWRGDASLEVWVPNFAKVLESGIDAPDVAVSLRYCRDDPAARASVAQHQADLTQWMAAVTRWTQLRKTDPEGAGARPVRPAEPRFASQPCRDSDIPATP